MFYALISYNYSIFLVILFLAIESASICCHTWRGDLMFQCLNGSKCCQGLFKNSASLCSCLLPIAKYIMITMCHSHQGWSLMSGVQTEKWKMSMCFFFLALENIVRTNIQMRMNYKSRNIISSVLYTGVLGPETNSTDLEEGGVIFREKVNLILD